MTWKLVGTRELATIEIPRVTPGVTPAATIRDFVTQHRLLKNMLEKMGEKRQCATVDSIVVDSGLSANDVDRHMRIFEMDGYMTKVSNNVVCSAEAINELMSVLKKKRRML